jgi:hypothetical protein
MAAISTNLTDKENILINYWNDAKGAKVIKTFTAKQNGMFSEVKEGTLSHKYEHCYFYFYDEDGNEVIENNLSNFQKTHYHKNVEQKRQLLNELNRDKEIILNSIQYLKKLNDN